MLSRLPPLPGPSILLTCLLLTLALSSSAQDPSTITPGTKGVSTALTCADSQFLQISCKKKLFIEVLEVQFASGVEGCGEGDGDGDAGDEEEERRRFFRFARRGVLLESGDTRRLRKRDECEVDEDVSGQIMEAVQGVCNGRKKCEAQIGELVPVAEDCAGSGAGLTVSYRCTKKSVTTVKAKKGKKKSKKMGGDDDDDDDTGEEDEEAPVPAKKAKKRKGKAVDEEVEDGGDEDEASAKKSKKTKKKKGKKAADEDSEGGDEEDAPVPSKKGKKKKSKASDDDGEDDTDEDAPVPSRKSKKKKGKKGKAAGDDDEDGADSDGSSSSKKSRKGKKKKGKGGDDDDDEDAGSGKKSKKKKGKKGGKSDGKGDDVPQAKAAAPAPPPPTPPPPPPPPPPKVTTFTKVDLVPGQSITLGPCADTADLVINPESIMSGAWINSNVPKPGTVFHVASHLGFPSTSTEKHFISAVFDDVYLKAVHFKVTISGGNAVASVIDAGYISAGKRVGLPSQDEVHAAWKSKNPADVNLYRVIGISGTTTSKS